VDPPVQDRLREAGDLSMKLDVGCGIKPRGDVNCDLFIKDIGHRTGRPDLKGATIDPKKIPNFVLCDGEHLPFKNGVFSEVFSSHVIEHVYNPGRFLLELLRVSNERIVIQCPHRLGDKLNKATRASARYHIHKNFLNKTWFFQLRKLGHYVEAHYDQYLDFPNELFSVVRVPISMEVLVIKEPEGK
jgi:SAM-dependent methyltransferase